MLSLASLFPEEKEHWVQAELVHSMQSAPYLLEQVWQRLLVVLKYQSIQMEEHSLEVRFAQVVQVDPEGTEIWEAHGDDALRVQTPFDQ